MKKTMFRMPIILTILLMGVYFLTVTSCKKDDPIVTPDVILDGLYVMGDVTAVPALATKGMMKGAINEVNQTARVSLYELYIPIKAGAAGFSIVQVAGATKKTFGPGTDFANVTAGTTDEPKVTFQRGSTKETTTKFTVPTDGMYHVVIDIVLNKVVIIPVHWGIIGAATPSGWGTSTPLTESAFDLNSMNWSITNMELRGGDWKFRYSNGWKTELDTVLDLGGGNKGVKINTNFGKAIDDLVAGGANIVNAAPGVYSLTFTYTLGTGYKAVVTKTADLPLTNWTGVKCDAVGDGISLDNTTAHADTSSWKWGNAILADAAGIPTKVGDKYTWTWSNVTLEATKGFKIRTFNGVAPSSGGANFDAGFSALKVSASATEIADASGNLSTTLKAVYTMTLVIDAANNDSKEIIIVKK